MSRIMVWKDPISGDIYEKTEDYKERIEAYAQDAVDTLNALKDDFAIFGMKVVSEYDPKYNHYYYSVEGVEYFAKPLDKSQDV